MPSPYKTIRCRYFDSLGNPIRPHCSQGRRCGFIHPDDKNWYPVDDDQSKSPRSDRTTRRAALTSQCEVYKRANASEADARCDHGDSVVTGLEKMYQVQTARTEKDGKVPLNESSSVPKPHPITSASVQERTRTTDEIVDLFQKIAHFSNQSMQGRIECDSEDLKLKKYRELSETLAKISPSSVTAIAPTLASIVDHRGACKSKLKENLKELGYLWEDALEIFLKTVVTNVEDRVDDSLNSFRRECDNLVATFESKIAKVIADASQRATFENPATSGATNAEKRRRRRSRERSASASRSQREWVTQQSKRPRLSRESERERDEDGASRDRELGEVTDYGKYAKKTEGERGSTRDLIELLQARVDDQDKKIEHLVKENDTLATSLRNHGNAIPHTDFSSNHQLAYLGCASPAAQTLLSPHQIGDLRTSIQADCISILDGALEDQRKLNRTFDGQLRDLERNVSFCANQLNHRLSTATNANPTHEP